MRLDLFITPIHLKYQITCRVPPPLERDLLRHAVIHALCAERAYRQTVNPARGAYVPLWLTRGLTESLYGQRDQLLGALRQSVRGGRPITASALLTAEQLPGDEREVAIFEANAWVFVESLLAIPSGAGRLDECLRQVGEGRGSVEAFWETYRDVFADDRALEKWWSVQLQSRASQIVAQNLTASETSRRLSQLLTMRVEIPEGSIDLQPAEWLPYFEKRWMKDALRERFNQFELLAGVAHPLYRECLRMYSEAALLLLAEKTSRYKRALADADKLRGQADRKMREIADYVDAAERRFAPEDTDRFQPYFEMFDALQKLQEKRRNPVSDYLDRFDR